ncbi:MAG: helix-turn-helix domain-containing protein [Acetivibrionales bacterium]|jgi:excisionase family DNA binding protein
MLQKTLLSPKEAAVLLGVSYKTVLRLSRSKDFPALRIGEKKIGIPADMLQEWQRKEAAKPLE